ncbi:polymerase gamma 1 [Hibiscus syriacus]|uniref:Polymerase gamma 1 n=1 Tax=Hibiscus syriacus TaxID=106335 RepID=A0A6A2XC51_HIBSY|nr:polymerase gamma 1 [Hibiscus syriacus]
MNCFSCCMSEEKIRSRRTNAENDFPDEPNTIRAMLSFANISFKSDGSRKRYISEEIVKRGKNSATAKTFNYRDLCTATNNFNPESQLGEGGFGRVYKGQVDNPNQVVHMLLLSSNLTGMDTKGTKSSLLRS